MPLLEVLPVFGGPPCLLYGNVEEPSFLEILAYPALVFLSSLKCTRYRDSSARIGFRDAPGNFGTPLRDEVTRSLSLPYSII